MTLNVFGVSGWRAGSFEIARTDGRQGNHRWGGGFVFVITLSLNPWISDFMPSRGLISARLGRFGMVWA